VVGATQDASRTPAVPEGVAGGVFAGVFAGVAADDAWAELGSEES
jgi:hypothetical protein